jgi:hypothetical protein
MNTADLLVASETCSRKGYWSRDWQSNRMTGVEMLQEALRAAVLTDRSDYGDLAGETVMELAESRGLETPSHNLYDSACHHAALADLLANAIRKPKDGPWSVPETLVRKSYLWHSGALLDPRGEFLRRFVLASSWSPERMFGECNSWRSLGEVVQYRMPMQMIVIVLGPHRDGKRHSPFTKGLLHPRSHKLRFRKKSQSTSSEFKETWDRVWREDRAEILPHQWLDAMIQDDVLKEHLFVVDIPVPDESRCKELLEMAERKLKAIWSTLPSSPDRQLSGCFFPAQCQYVHCCHGKWKEPSEKGGFIPLQHLFQFDVSHGS